MNTINVGDVISFGDYDWRVLDIKNGRALILSEKLLPAREENQSYISISWRNWPLRNWLNNEFYSRFSPDEIARIKQVRVKTKANPWYGENGGDITDDGRSTDDKIFLLSLEETVKYLGDSGKLRNRPASDAGRIEDEFNSTRLARYADGRVGHWWLRSPGEGDWSDNAAYVGYEGGISVEGRQVEHDSYGVRPAMWIQIGEPDQQENREWKKISFGDYDWLVLDERDGRKLLLCDKIIDTQEYNDEYTDITWADCSLRGWLNGEFYGNFRVRDGERIAETRITNSGNTWYGTNSGSDTVDRIFLLSVEETVKYFGDSGQYKNRPQDAWLINDRYNYDRRAFDDDPTPPKRWWLRTSGEYPNKATYVYPFGEIYVDGCRVDDIDCGVRPALWLTI